MSTSHVPLDISVSAFRRGSKEWTPVSENLFYDMLGAVPPEDQIVGAFLCGEPWDCNGAGEYLFRAFRHNPWTQIYETRIMTKREFRAEASAAPTISADGVPCV